jgi:hypothetical protein
MTMSTVFGSRLSRLRMKWDHEPGTCGWGEEASTISGSTYTRAPSATTLGILQFAERDPKDKLTQT